MTGSVVLAAGTVAALTTPATAETQLVPIAPVGIASTPLDAMQRDLGLTLQQAQDRLELENVADQTALLLRNVLGGGYGGAHFDAKSGKLIVGVTDPSEFSKVESAGAVPRLVRHTAGELTAVADGLNQHDATVPKTVSGWYVDSGTNSVVLTTAHGTTQQAQQFVHASGVKADAVKVVESAESPRTYADVVGGNAYSVGTRTRCSIGFSVSGGFLTAGHCGKQGDTTTQPSGTFEGSSFPGNDYAFVRTAPGETPQPLVNDYQGGTVAVAGSTEAAEGTSVCRSGSTTGWHCGTVQAKNQTVSYLQGQASGLTRTDVCAEPGDSGGSFLSGDQAQGTTSGGSGDCTSGGTTYFQPVNEALGAYGVSLLTR
jgi:streptogrisin C